MVAATIALAWRDQTSQSDNVSRGASPMETLGQLVVKRKGYLQLEGSAIKRI